jgi:Ser/Thr protein kinase RdoA (MazF antagonist)
MHERGLTPERLHRVGVFAGRMHGVAARLERTGILRTRRLAFTPDLGAWARGTRTGLRSLSPGLVALAPEVARRVAGELDAMPCGPASHGFIHADLHPWNLLFARDIAGAIDFSDCGWGHFALDLATVLQYLKFPLEGHHDHSRRYPELRARLLEGYAQAQALPPNLDAQIDTYLVARLFSTLEWMLDDWPSLHHHRWGPAFQRTCQQAFRTYLS